MRSTSSLYVGKPSAQIAGLWIGCWLLMLGVVAPARAQRVEVQFVRREPDSSIVWTAKVRDASGVDQWPAFEVQQSTDLNTWTVLASGLQGREGVQGELLSTRIAVTGPKAFYRVLARLAGAGRVSKLANGGAEVFGYAAAFNREVETIGQISPEEFSARFSESAGYLEKLNWDPTTAEFWNEFNTDPQIYNLTLLPGVDDFRLYDFRLNAAELAIFKKNGFVVSERLGGSSCGQIFSRLWIDDLPVFIAADPVLQAWHRSYDMMLAELEETFLFENTRQMLNGMASKVSAVAGLIGEGVLKESVLDADYFVAVGRSLLEGTTQPSMLGQDARVKATLTAVTNLQLDLCFNLFGRPRAVDFSQFKPRGHYTESERLSRYFQCVMWLGRTDFRVAGGPYEDASEMCGGAMEMAPTRDLGTAIVLNQLLKDSGQFSRWQQFDGFIQKFVGWTDSMTFGQLDGILEAAGIDSAADVVDEGALLNLQSALETAQLGVQQIRSDWFASPFGPEQIKLPQSFTVFGQKFILDSWALSKVVFDDIIWDENGVAGPEDKVSRRVPSGLDVAFSVFGNNQIVPEIVSRIRDQSPERHLFRDGWNYQHNLAALRAVIEQQEASSWNANLYMGWLASLRELSTRLVGESYPDAVRTRAWAMKDLNTQLASWTHLRHDTVLYAKQSYTGGGSACSYPSGFVEPRPAFWRRLRDMVKTATELLGSTDYSGKVQYEFPKNSGNMLETNLASIQARQVKCLQAFSEVVSTLLDMSERELRQEPFTQEQQDFLQRTIHAQSFSGWGGVQWWNVYDGWYPKLFYKPLSKEIPGGTPPEGLAQAEGEFQLNDGALRWDALVTDVHTDVPCDVAICGPYPDPGSVLHEGIGRAHLLMIAVNNGPDRRVYAGPVLSHYEFELVGPPQRLSDPEWKERWLKAGFDQWSAADDGSRRDWSQIPENPSWTRSYLAPLAR